MWSVWQTCRTGRRVAGFLGGLLVALLLAAGPVTGQSLPSLPNQATLSNGGVATSPVVAAGLTRSREVQVYFAWKEGQDIYLKRALARPGSCGSEGTLEFDTVTRQLSSFNSTFLSFSSPAIAANARGEVFVAWVETPNTGFQYIRLSRALEGDPPSLQPVDFVNFNSTFPGANPSLPSVAADNGGGVFVAAEGRAGGKASVLLARPGSGATPLNVTANRTAPFSRRPSIASASDGSKVHVVWRETILSPERRQVDTGIYYKGFAPGSDQTTLDNSVGTVPLTTAPVSLPPKVAVYGGEVTAAWFEGTSLMARTTTGGTFLDSAAVIHPASTRLSNLSLSVGPAGQLFGWQETDTSTMSNRYLLQAATARRYESGSFFEEVPSSPTSGPSVAQDGSGGVVASWKEGTTPAQIKRGYAGGSGDGGTKKARVWSAPAQVNSQSMKPGPTRRPNLTVFIEPVFLPGETEDWSVADIYASTVTLNGKSAIGPSSLADHDGNGKQDLMVKFDRSDLVGAPYEVRGDMKQPAGSKGCPFSGILPVEITP